MIYYTADLHFGHANILRLSNRPFQTVEEMDITLINNINARVKEDDDLYILGDFSFKGKNPTEYLSRIHGKKHLIIGNHDGKLINNKEAMAMFEDVAPYRKINDNGRQVILCHYPIAEWDGFFRTNAYHLFGHVHNNFQNPWHEFMSKLHNNWNVGVDVTGYEPVTLDELIEGKTKNL